MIVGLGIDLLEIGRVERELARGEWPAGDSVFTAAEIRHGQSTGRPVGHFAACFAAKEAALKALGLPIEDLAMFREIEVAPDDAGLYTIGFHGRPKAAYTLLGARRARISITQRAHHVGATVILED